MARPEQPGARLAAAAQARSWRRQEPRGAVQPRGKAGPGRAGAGGGAVRRLGAGEGGGRWGLLCLWWWSFLTTKSVSLRGASSGGGQFFLNPVWCCLRERLGSCWRCGVLDGVSSQNFCLPVWRFTRIILLLDHGWSHKRKRTNLCTTVRKE